MVRAIYRDQKFHVTVPINLKEGEEVNIIIQPQSEVRRLAGAFKIQNVQLLDEIIESEELDMFE